MEEYSKEIDKRAGHVFEVMKNRVSPEELTKIKEAFELAKVAHAPQKRKTGEPYIFHPIAVATIAAEELMLDVPTVMAAFLHDVVEDTPYTLQDIRERFGDEVAFLVDVVTKKEKVKYDSSRQVDNFKQMLNSLQQDVRPLLIKLADRLHNMRTLSSMPPHKQMKIAGETDYFYAPLANRLGFYNVKTELENLSFRFRTPHEYEEISALVARDQRDQNERLSKFCDQIRETLEAAAIKARIFIEYRRPYSIWRKMHKYGDDFNHLKYRHFTEIIFDTPEGMSEKEMALKIYAVLTDRFKEKPGGISNYIDSPKENGYQSFHVKLLPAFGRWQEVHISSERMVRDSQLGCVAEQGEGNIGRWIEKFRSNLREISEDPANKDSFIDNVVSSFYNDDIMTFTHSGREVILPQRATVLDFAYEVDPAMAEKAQYARINGFLASIKAPLRRGDVVEVFTSEGSRPQADWLRHAVSYKAKTAIRHYLDSVPKPEYQRCPHCKPIPGEEVVGFKLDSGEIVLHKRDCPDSISLASRLGDRIVAVDFKADKTLYPVTIVIHAVDRPHLFVDLVDNISNHLNLSIDSVHTDTVDAIVTAKISFSVHSYYELQSIMKHIKSIKGVDDVNVMSSKELSFRSGSLESVI